MQRVHIMENKNVAAFIKVVEFNNFTKAAESMGYSQAAVTAQIKALEKELGVFLFDRMGKRICLTQEGKAFLPYAYNMLKAEEEAKKELGIVFSPVEETVTAKDATNLRDVPSQGEDSTVMLTLQNGQIATQYVDLNGNPTMDTAFNPNGSLFAIEGITSPDGRVLGKMGHSERRGDNLYKNVDGNKWQPLFEGAVESVQARFAKKGA